MQTRPLLGTLLFTALLPALAAAQDSDADGVVDSADSHPCDASIAATRFAPAEDQHAVLLFEDEWPRLGDADFNDVVLTYNYVVYEDAQGRAVRIQATFNPLALGGEFVNGFGVHLPVPTAAVGSMTRTLGSGSPAPLAAHGQDGELTVDVLGDLRAAFGGAQGVVNAIDGASQAHAAIQVDITLSTPTSLDMALAPFDVFIFRTQDRAHEIHRAGYGGTSQMNGALFGTHSDRSAPGRWFTDGQGLPFALDLPAYNHHPKEGVDVAQLFPRITNWASSGGTQDRDFYTGDTVLAAAFAGTPALQAVMLTISAPPDTSCSAVEDTNTVLLMHMDGSLADSSRSNHTVTAQGNAGTVASNGAYPASNSGFAGAANFPNPSGVNDQLRVSQSPDWDFGNGDFTAEAWVYPTGYGSSGYGGIITTNDYSRYSSAHGFVIRFWASTSRIYVHNSNSSLSFTSAGSLPLNAWSHVALVRSGNLFRIFINGQQDGAATYSGAIGASSQGLAIGTSWHNYHLHAWQGRIDEVRVSKGIARYVTSFAPPSAPFTTLVPAPPPNTTDPTAQLLLHMESGFADSSPSSHPVLVAGAVSSNASAGQPTSDTNFGNAAYFPNPSGVQDFLQYPASPDFDFGTGDFTIESWVYPTGFGSSGYGGIFTTNDYNTRGTPHGIVLRFWANSTQLYVHNVNSSLSFRTQQTLPLNAWSHVALVRSGNSFYVFVNGVRDSVVGTYSGAVDSSVHGFAVGRSWFNYHLHAWQGFIDELRVSKGQARYTADFTPPASPFGTELVPTPAPGAQDGNTRLVASMDPGFADTSGNGHTAAVTGNVTATTNGGQPANASGFGTAAHFPNPSGVQDYLTYPASTDWNFGQANFTIEAWVKPTGAGSSGYGGIVSTNDYGQHSTPHGIVMRLWSSSTRIYVHNSNSSLSFTTSGSIPLNQWSHVALVRIGHTFTVFINGQRDPVTGTYSGNVDGTSRGLLVGRSWHNYHLHAWQGYIDDIRISRGVARYTTSFTPPTTPF